MCIRDSIYRVITLIVDIIISIIISFIFIKLTSRTFNNYSNEETDLLLTVVSKKEAVILRRILREKDPNAFIIMDEDISVAGNFQKRL